MNNLQVFNKIALKDNRINFAKYQIFRYANELFVCISELMNPEIEQSMNLPSHGLSQEELVLVLFELFSEYMLVAKNDKRGFFTPSLQEIEAALLEDNDYSQRSKNTFYGITTGAMELYRELDALYGKRGNA